MNQFLSPLTNVRRDKWGGTLENRCRFLKRILQQSRKLVGLDFPMALKLNSSDFQRGGFSEEESLGVVKMLDGHIDLLEISGGTYEKMVVFLMNDESSKDNARKGEAYFIDFAHRVRSISNVPLMVTGGFRSFTFCNQVLENGELDLLGMARPFITNGNDIKGFIAGEVPKLKNLVMRTGIKQFEDAAEGGFYARQLLRLAKGKELKLNMSPTWSSNFLILHELKKALAKKLA
ncbi:MAG: hypothetical protein HKN87_08910 [Saprospiraceae bacterium]|nr:hypothetical protein [Saprospiraceae bacterium]